MEYAAASAFVKVVMGRLFLVLEKEYSKHKGLAQETQSLQQDLRMIAAAMDDQLRPLGRSDRTAVARRYSEQMLDLAHDMEDCVDRFMNHRLRCCGGTASSSLVHRVAHELKKVRSRSSFADEIHKLKRRLREEHKRVIDVVPIACVGGQPNASKSMTASSSASHCSRPAVGIAKPVEELVSLLDEVEGEPEQLRVISIVGFGGLGKTTLARQVYDSPHAKAKFDCRAWVAAAAGGSPETSDGIRGILRDVLRQVRSKDTMDADGEQPEALLKEFLKDKRYLVVVDDIRMDEWSTLTSVFEDNGTCSRIIVTTAIQSVANMCSHGNGYVYQMNTLGQEDSKRIAFPCVMTPELEQGSEALLGKCDGLPLALVSVCNYLKSSREPTGELCEKLSRNLGSHLKEKHEHDNFSELRRVLLDSYDSLPSNSLTCLLYLGIFPNNRPFKRKVVVRRWLAEGYARSDSICSEQDIADENFDKLIDRNIIQPIKTRSNSHAKTCKTHGVMHEFVLHKSLSQRFVATLSSPDHPTIGVNAHNARHLSIHAGAPTERVASDEALSRVRSLTVFGDAGDAISYVSKCKLIRVLDLEECNDLQDDCLKCICNLWHLKYLSLGGTICELPRCIERLHCLETLDVRRSKIKLLPIEAIQLPHLTHLFGKFMLDKDDLKNVSKMRMLRKFLSGNKSKLQTLSGFCTNESKGFLQLMGDMKKLGKVKIWCKHVACSGNYIGDLSQAIQQFTKVPIDKASDRSLALDFEECSENFMSSLDLEPCSEDYKYDLRSLKLHGKLLQLPPFVTLLSGLTELCISTATLRWDLLSAALVSLRRLLYLKLIAIQLASFKIEPGAFPSLRRLCFVVRSLISALPTIEQGALPNLVSLQLLCHGLVGLSGIEIRHLRHLNEIMIDSNVNAETRKDWERAAKNHPNRPRVLFLEMDDWMEREGQGPCAMREKRKRLLPQPSLDNGLDSALKKMKLSDASSRLQVIVHPGVVTGTKAASSSSSIEVPMHTDEPGCCMQLHN